MARFASQVGFRDAVFEEPVSFLRAVFLPEQGRASVDCHGARFGKGVNFRFAKFGKEGSWGEERGSVETSFYESTFGGDADFELCYFSGSSTFTFGTFAGKADFRDARFETTAEFMHASFAGYVRFEGGKKRPGFGEGALLTFEDAAFEKPERVLFHTLALRPHWFIRCDARKFGFTNVEWSGGLRQELKRVRGRDDAGHRLLAVAYWNLGANAEENNRYAEASTFRYNAMDAALAEHRWLSRWARLEWWYRVSSGYGERVGRAFVVLAAIWFIFGLLYTRVEFNPSIPRATGTASANTASRAPSSASGTPVTKDPRLGNALVYSLGVMTLQKPEPRPASLIGRNARST